MYLCHMVPCTAVIVEINSETDFVARNDLFQQLVGQVAAAALASQGTATAAAQSRCEELPIDQVSVHTFVCVCVCASTVPSWVNAHLHACTRDRPECVLPLECTCLVYVLHACAIDCQSSCAVQTMHACAACAHRSYKPRRTRARVCQMQ